MKEETPAQQMKQEATNGPHLILASSSPRRRELVALLGLPYVVVPSRYEEPPAPDTPVDLPEFVTRLALGKAREVAERMGRELNAGAVVLGADTLVAPDDAEVGVPLGKPRDDEDARRMLRVLSGRTHRVYTGIALVTASSSAVHLAAVCTRVRFRALTDTMIADYVETGEPLDKAGAYGAQGYAAPFIESLEGDFFNVVGLPLCAVGRALEMIQSDWWRQRSGMTSEAE